MNADPLAHATASWRALQISLAGSFTARSRGFLGDEFLLLDGDGGEWGRLKMMGLEGAKLGAGNLEATIERPADFRYEVISGGGRIAWSSAASADKLEVWCGERAYTANVSLLRNKATIRDEADNETARLAGNLTGRAYGAEINAEDPCALPVAVLLIYHTTLHRRRAYRASPGR